MRASNPDPDPERSQLQDHDACADATDVDRLERRARRETPATEATMHYDDQRFASIPLDRLLGAVLALLIADREEHRSATAPRTETILAGAGLTEADIAAVTGGDPTGVRAILDGDRPVSVIDRARAHMTRSAM